MGFHGNVSKSNQAHKAHSNPQAGWDFITACQQIKSNSQSTQQLTSWMGFHGSMSANQIKLTKHAATHWLDEISWPHVSKSNQANKAHSNLLAGQDFMATCQKIKTSSQSTQQLTPWIGFHASMLVNQIKLTKHTATHSLDEISWQHVSKSSQSCKHTSTHLLDRISWQHVSKSNQANKAHNNSLPGWDFMAACQHIKLTKHTATH